jgi:hypothetical protein
VHVVTPACMKIQRAPILASGKITELAYEDNYTNLARKTRMLRTTTKLSGFMENTKFQSGTMWQCTIDATAVDTISMSPRIHPRVSLLIVCYVCQLPPLSRSITERLFGLLLEELGDLLFGPELANEDLSFLPLLPISIRAVSLMLSVTRLPVIQL